MKKKVISLIILTFIIVLSTSCNGSRELDQIGIVTAVALDKENEKIILTTEVVIPSATATSTFPVRLRFSSHDRRPAGR